MTTVRLPLAATRARRRPWGRSRTLRRVAGDAQALLAIGLVVTSLCIAAIGDGGDVSRVIAVSVLFLTAQILAAIAGPYIHPSANQRTLISAARFGLAILYVSVVTGLLRSGEFRPTGALFIPIVALAAGQGARQAALVGAAAIVLYLLPVLSATRENLTIDAQRA